MRLSSILQVCEILEYSYLVSGKSLFSTRNSHSPCRGVSVVCNVSRGRIFRPILLPNFVNWEFHIYRVQEFLGKFTEGDIAEIWLQQDCATCHAVGASVCELSLLFTDGMTPKGIWPPLLPDLSSPIFSSRAALETASTAITHAFGVNRNQHIQSLPTFDLWRFRKCLGARFVVFGYVGNMLVHTLRDRILYSSLPMRFSLQASPYCACNFPQNGPSPIIHDNITIPNIGFVSRDSDCTTGWTTEESEFESLWGQEYSLLHVVQTGSGVHPTCYLLGTGDSFTWSKAAEAWSWLLTSN
jgi:hypothetical protein